MSPLLYLLVGAGFTLISQTAIQLVVVPRAEARKRREDRWERDVLALAELLSTELPDRATTARRDQWVMCTLHRDWATATDVDPTRREQAERRLHEDVAQSLGRYRASARTRLEWLGERIVRFDPSNRELISLRHQLFRFKVVSTLCTVWDYPKSDFDETEFDKTWNAEGEASAALALIVKDLAHRRPPRERLIDRVLGMFKHRRAPASPPSTGGTSSGA